MNIINLTAYFYIQIYKYTIPKRIRIPNLHFGILREKHIKIIFVEYIILYFKFLYSSLRISENIILKIIPSYFLLGV